MKDIAPLQRGFDLPTTEMCPGNYPVVMSNGIGGYHSTYKVNGPGVVTGRSGTIGKLQYIEDNYWPHNTTLWVTNFYGNNPKYIYYLYQNLDFSRFTSGSGVPTLNRNDVHDFWGNLPSIGEQLKIEKFMTNLDEFITLHQRKLNLWKFCKNRSKVMDDFDKEVDFEAALITALQRYGWGQEVIKYPTEKELIQNWADILFENNRSIDRLGDFPLVQEEIDDLLEQINRLRTPLALNGFINGKTVSITRKNPKDTLHYGKEVSLKIYDPMEIAALQSRYQIVQQPLFARHEKVLQDRRGDLMLLINGMPVFHIELKKSGVPVIEAANSD